MKNFSIATRIGGGFSVMLLLILAVGLAGLFGIRGQHERVTQLINSDIAFNVRVSEMVSFLGRMRSAEKDTLISFVQLAKVKEYRQQWEQANKQFLVSLDAARASPTRRMPPA